MLSVRPRAAELVFQLYGRVLHPELFEICTTRSFDRGGYSAAIAITGFGHVVTWRCQGLTLTEVATAVSQPMPLKRRLLSHRIGAERSDRLECRGGIRYETCFHLERADAEVFGSLQQDLVAAGARRGLVHRFEAPGRLSPGALSWIDVETRPRSLLVQAFHTFPDDLALVKSQSLFELP